jgi:hypothetical protein
MPQRAPGQQIRPVLSRPGGPAGAEVTLTMDGVLPFLSVRIGFGSLSQYEVLARVDADAFGKLEADLEVPAWAELDRVHYFVVSSGNQMPRTLSDPFHVTDADGTARVYGAISAAGVACLMLDGPQSTLYALEGAPGSWAAGQRVMVIGTVMDRPTCGDRGLPIAVREIRPSL